MRVLFAAAEALPYWKTGGLADVARALPDALCRRGISAEIILPLYRALFELPERASVLGTAVLPWRHGGVSVRYLRDERPGAAPTILVDQPAFFGDSRPYEADSSDPFRPARRFALFSLAVLDYARRSGADVLHLNDWQTGLVPLYGVQYGQRIPNVFCLHNVAYQGNAPAGLLPEIGVAAEWFRTEGGVEFYGYASFLKAGLVTADALATVSPTHAQELQTPEYGARLDGVLRARAADLHGILNGIDTDAWNPASDAALPERYSAGRMEGKGACRAELVAQFGLTGGGPLFVAISRLVEQKGVDLLLGALPALLHHGGSLIVLGDGEARFEEALHWVAANNPRRVAAVLRFDDALARRLYAGGDYFVMASRYEPCGLGQMIAQRYGTPPVVRATGGLADTVVDGRSGFVFEPPTASALAAAIGRACAVWGSDAYLELQDRCMRLDRSWSRSAERYETLYREVRGGASD